jgi:hypothetical protein
MEFLKRLWANMQAVDFEELGYKIRLECDNREHAIERCACDIQSLEDHINPEVSKCQRLIEQAQHRTAALHAYLYNRADPVNDAAMLTHERKQRVLLAMVMFVAIASFAANATTGYLLGYGYLVNFAWAAGMTAVPVAIGHLFYEQILAHHKRLQAGLAVLAAVIAFAGFIEFGLARWDTIDKATAQVSVNSYVDGTTDPSTTPDPSSDQSDSQIHQTLGKSVFLIALAAELGLGLMFARLIATHHDEDYAAWRDLKLLVEFVEECQHEIAEFLAHVEIAKKQCAAGILRAENKIAKRRPPYHRAAMIAIAFGMLFIGRASAQTIKHYEAILIDTSGSIGRDGKNHELFHQYLASVRKLLLTEPPDSRVWVLLISKDSFGGTQELLSGWTPDARGVFTADLDRARQQLAAAFDQKSRELSPNAAGTDIFGALWRAKVLLQPAEEDGGKNSTSRTIWIFSDMMNETPSFPMPQLINLGSEQMLERASDGKLLVPLNGYHINVLGASTDGLTPRIWPGIRQFWKEYFHAAGARLALFASEATAIRF